MLPEVHGLVHGFDAVALGDDYQLIADKFEFSVRDIDFHTFLRKLGNGFDRLKGYCVAHDCRECLTRLRPIEEAVMDCELATLRARSVSPKILLQKVKDPVKTFLQEGKEQFYRKHA